MDTRPIGVFDSGLGGISVLRDMIKLLPNESFIYYGDSANAPYGTKSTEEIISLSKQCTNFLLDHDVKAIVIACNTATSAAAEILRKTYTSIPIIGIEPALKPAVLWKEHDKVGVMATPATLSLKKFLNLMHRYDSTSYIYPIPCKGLVEYIEAGKLTGPEITSFLSEILSPYKETKLDAVVLGCTHYPFVEPVIQEILGPEVKIFNGAEGTARELKRRLVLSELETGSTEKGSITFYNSSDAPEKFDLANMLLNA